MRDVVGQGELEDAAPRPAPWSSARRRVVACALAAVTTAALAADVAGPGGVLRADRAGADRAGADRAGADRAGVDRAGADRAGADRAGVDRAGASAAGPAVDRGSDASEDSGGDRGAAPSGGARPSRAAAAARTADPVLRAALAARPLGGDTVRTRTGASGAVRLEVRNGGAALRLLSLTAEVPGVRFSQVVRPNGVELGPEERVELGLGFGIDDCAQLRRTGRLVLVVEQAGVQQEVGLTVTHDREAGTVRQVALDRVLGACPS